MTSSLSPRQERTLRALCDTYVTSVEPPSVESGDPTGFWERTASDLDTHAAVADHVLGELDEEDREGMIQLLDVVAMLGFAHLPQAAREATLRGLHRLSDDIAEGLDAYRVLTMMEFYGRADAGRRNPNWEQFGYPGPPDITTRPAALRTIRPGPADDRLALEADVCVIGSGSGGGVVAGELAAAGSKVVVLEAGPDLQDPDFPPDELTALRTMYWRGVESTEDGNVVLMAGETLGGGSTVNWTNCVPPPAHVRACWAEEHGLEGLDGAGFDGHLEAVLDRISATRDASDLNGPNDLLRRGAEELGWSWHRAVRNADTDRYDPATAGHMGYGDRSGSKQGTLNTYLRDAVDAGADIVADCRADRIVVRDGRAVGVEAVFDGPDGPVPVTVDAGQVVVAGGALETPALLLRSGIGGPAVGRHLRVHPVPNLAGFYREPTRGWWGAPQTVIVDHHTRAVEDHGFLVECPHLHPGLAAAAVPWRSARDHKLVVGRSSNIATFIAVARERGSGRVTVDDRGDAVVRYPLDDELDRRLLRTSLASLVRLHVAAGAEAILDVHPTRPLWSRGDDVEAFVDRVTGLPFGKGDRTVFSAHQMGTARMGVDRSTSVADPEGQLHDVRGVWIGDTSAFPTAVGSNPMVTCMALARRTAHALLAAI